MERNVETSVRLQCVEAAAISRTGSYDPSKVEPRIATTPIVFSSQRLTASSAERLKRSPSIGTSRISTSQ